VIVLQHSSEALSAYDLSFTLADVFVGRNDLVLQSLMVSLDVIMFDEVIDRPAQHALTKEDPSVAL
jgi:hypothetical protein